MDFIMSNENCERFNGMLQEKEPKKYGKYMNLPIKCRVLSPVDETDEFHSPVKSGRNKNFRRFSDLKDRVSKSEDNPAFRNISLKEEFESPTKTASKVKQFDINEILGHEKNYINDLNKRKIDKLQKLKENRQISMANGYFRSRNKHNSNGITDDLRKPGLTVKEKLRLQQKYKQYMIARRKMYGDLVKEMHKPKNPQLKLNTRSNSMKESAKVYPVSPVKEEKRKRSQFVSLSDLNWEEILEDQTLSLNDRYKKLKIITQEHDNKIRLCERNNSNGEKITRAYISSIQAKLALLNSLT